MQDDDCSTLPANDRSHRLLCIFPVWRGNRFVGNQNFRRMAQSPPQWTQKSDRALEGLNKWDGALDLDPGTRGNGHGEVLEVRGVLMWLS